MNDKELLAYLRSSFNYDPATGLFTHKEKRSFHEGAPAGCLNRLGYVILNVKKKLFFAHRIAWFYVHSKWPAHYIDHINGCRSDNRISNLRDIPKALNHQNQRKAQANNKTGLLGVSFNKSRGHYVAQIAINGKRKYIGSFDTKEAAHAAYVRKKRELHPAGTL